MDDIIVKSKSCLEHRVTLQRALQLKAQSLQVCLWCVSGQFLGFLVHECGIRIDPAKLEAIRDMTPLASLKQLQSFFGEDQLYLAFHSQSFSKNPAFYANHEEE